MDEIISQADEQAKKREREEALRRKEEQEKQREHELAKEEGRKQGLKEARAQRKGGLGTRIKIILALFLFALVVIATIVLTLTVTVTPVSTGTALPFISNYGVSFPEGQTITIGNTHITVLSFENELISDIDGERKKLVVGEDRVISERRAVITTLGVITLVDTNFRINLTYTGNRDNRAYFDMAIHTSRQVPDILLSLLIPPEMDARPI
jgi:hypothetical protein